MVLSCIRVSVYPIFQFIIQQSKFSLNFVYRCFQISSLSPVVFCLPLDELQIDLRVVLHNEIGETSKSSQFNEFITNTLAITPVIPVTSASSIHCFALLRNPGMDLDSRPSYKYM